jgi:hypothetical protein
MISANAWRPLGMPRVGRARDVRFTVTPAVYEYARQRAQGAISQEPGTYNGRVSYKLLVGARATDRRHAILEQ